MHTLMELLLQLDGSDSIGKVRMLTPMHQIACAWTSDEVLGIFVEPALDKFAVGTCKL